MDEAYESVMAEVGLGGDLGKHENKLIEREVLLDNAKYEQLREKIVELKRYFDLPELCRYHGTQTLFFIVLFDESSAKCHSKTTVSALEFGAATVESEVL